MRVALKTRLNNALYGAIRIGPSFHSVEPASADLFVRRAKLRCQAGQAVLLHSSLRAALDGPPHS